MAAMSPEPCQGTSATSGSWPSDAKRTKCGKKTSESRLAVLVGFFGQSREGEAWGWFMTACEGGEHGRGEEQKGDGRRDRIAW